MFYEKFSLDRSLNDSLVAIKSLHTEPRNPHYSRLPTTIQVNLDDLPISMVLSPAATRSDEDWTHTREVDDVSASSDDESELAFEEVPKQLDLRVEPFQTLLLIDDDSADSVKGISTRLIGLGVRNDSLDESDGPSPMVRSRRGSKDTSLEEDEGILMRSLIEACDVSKP